MTKAVAHRFWDRVLQYVVNKKGDELLKNPMLESVEDLYEENSKMANDDYHDHLMGCMQLACAVWDEDEIGLTDDLFQKALEVTNISDERLEKIADILSDASIETEYQVEPTFGTGVVCSDMRNERRDAEKRNRVMARCCRTPKEIENWLHTSGGIIGQNAAVKIASLIMYNHIEGRSSVSLFAAPTGSGKTEIWRALRDLYGDNIIIHDASTLTAEGWKGSNKISTIFKNIPPHHRGHIVLVLDEFDKLLEPQYGSQGSNYSDVLQNQLLRLCDHDTLFFGSENEEGFTVDTSGISIVFLGAFQRIMEKKSSESGSIGFGGQPHRDCNYNNAEITVEELVKYGMREELAGRITRITCMSPLDVDTLIRIGHNEVKKLASLMHREISVDNNTILMLARIAAKKGLGARWLRSSLNCMLDDLIYEDPDAKKYVIEYEPPNVDERRQTSGIME